MTIPRNWANELHGPTTFMEWTSSRNIAVCFTHDHTDETCPLSKDSSGRVNSDIETDSVKDRKMPAKNNWNGQGQELDLTQSGNQNPKSRPASLPPTDSDFKSLFADSTDDEADMSEMLEEKTLLFTDPESLW
jgi:hypothetical protein